VNGDDILLDTNAIIAATAIVHGFPWSLPISDLAGSLI